MKLIEKSNLSAASNRIISYLLIAYIFTILGRSIWYNWKLNQQIELIQTQIEQVKKENKNLENLVIYYQSDSFKEVEARKKLGLKKSGETAVPIPALKYENYAAEIQSEKKNFVELVDDPQKTNYEKWWDFLFH